MKGTDRPAVPQHGAEGDFVCTSLCKQQSRDSAIDIAPLRRELAEPLSEVKDGAQADRGLAPMVQDPAMPRDTLRIAEQWHLGFALTSRPHSTFSGRRPSSAIMCKSADSPRRMQAARMPTLTTAGALGGRCHKGDWLGLPPPRKTAVRDGPRSKFVDALLEAKRKASGSELAAATSATAGCACPDRTSSGIAQDLAGKPPVDPRTPRQKTKSIQVSRSSSSGPRACQEDGATEPARTCANRVANEQRVTTLCKQGVHKAARQQEEDCRGRTGTVCRDQQRQDAEGRAGGLRRSGSRVALAGCGTADRCAQHRADSPPACVPQPKKADDRAGAGAGVRRAASVGGVSTRKAWREEAGPQHGAQPLVYTESVQLPDTAGFCQTGGQQTLGKASAELLGCGLDGCCNNHDGIRVKDVSSAAGGSCARGPEKRGAPDKITPPARTSPDKACARGREDVKAISCIGATLGFSAGKVGKSKAWERLLAARDAAEKAKLERDGAQLVAALIKQKQRGFAEASRACHAVRLAQQTVRQERGSIVRSAGCECGKVDCEEAARGGSRCGAQRCRHGEAAAQARYRALRPGDWEVDGGGGCGGSEGPQD